MGEPPNDKTPLSAVAEPAAAMVIYEFLKIEFILLISEFLSVSLSCMMQYASIQRYRKPKSRVICTASLMVRGRDESSIPLLYSEKFDVVNMAG